MLDLPFPTLSSLRPPSRSHHLLWGASILLWAPLRHLSLCWLRLFLPFFTTLRFHIGDCSLIFLESGPNHNILGKWTQSQYSWIVDPTTIFLDSGQNMNQNFLIVSLRPGLVFLAQAGIIALASPLYLFVNCALPPTSVDQSQNT